MLPLLRGRRGHGLKVYVPPDAHAEIMTFSVMVLGGGPLGDNRVRRMKLIKDPREPPHPFHHVRPSEKVGPEASPDAKPARASILDFQPPEREQ
jgi:hypothetical protein